MQDFFNSQSHRPLTEKDYQISRILFLIEGCTGMAIFTLTSGAFLAGFFNYLEIGDWFNGILAGFPVLFGIVLLFGPFFLQRLEQRKHFIIITGILFRTLLALMFVIPLLTKGWFYNSALTAFVYGLAAILNPFYTLAIGNWLISLTPDRLRGQYLGLKDALTYIFLTVVNIFMGWTLDIYKAQGKQEQGFMICGITVMVLMMINAIALWMAKEPKVSVNHKRNNPPEVLVSTFRDNGFRKVILFYILWNFGLQFAAPFVNVYLVSGLKLNYTYIMMMGLITNALRVLTNPIWGRFADWHSWESTTKISLLLLAGSHGLLFLINRETVHYLYPIFAILSGIAWGGAGIATFSLQFNYTPEAARTVYLAANTAISGVAGFSATVAGSFIIGYMGLITVKPFGLNISPMQIVFITSGVLLAISALFIHLHLQKSSKS